MGLGDVEGRALVATHRARYRGREREKRREKEKEKKEKEVTSIFSWTNDNEEDLGQGQRATTLRLMAKEGDLFFRFGRLSGQSEARGHVDRRRSELCCCGAFLFFLFQVFFSSFFLLPFSCSLSHNTTDRQWMICSNADTGYQETTTAACHGLRLISGTNNSDSSMTGCGFV